MPAQCSANGVFVERDHRLANDSLTEFVHRHGHEFERCDGSSPNLAWMEEGLPVHGMSRARAAEVGALFGQVAMFEVDSEELRMVRCDDASVIRATARLPSRSVASGV